MNATKKIHFLGTQKTLSSLSNTFQMKDMICLLIKWNEPIKFWWKLPFYLDTSNQNNCKRMVSTWKQIFTAEFERTYAIVTYPLDLNSAEETSNADT